jgi:alpha-L-fucosidase
MKVNGEAIYGTRPWKTFGEGPSMGNEEKAPFEYIANTVKDVRKYRAGDLRFTTKGKNLYVFCMERPEGDIHIRSLGLKTANGKKISSIKLLGSKEKIEWTQIDNETVIRKPAVLPNFTTLVFEIK